MGPLFEGRHLPRASLVQDLARFFLSKIITPNALPKREFPQARLREFRHKWKRLVAFACQAKYGRPNFLGYCQLFQ